jgi:hypothetical protein
MAIPQAISTRRMSSLPSAAARTEIDGRARPLMGEELVRWARSGTIAARYMYMGTQDMAGGTTGI